MPLNKELPIAISMGEPGGINIEIILKCIKKKLPVFFLIADPDWAAKSIKALNSSAKINIIENIDNCSKGHLNILPIKNKVKFGFKKSYDQNVPAIIESLNLSIKLAKKKKVAGIVTLPIMKKTLIINGFKYPGHTEYLGKVSNKRPLMIMLNKKLKVATLTTHIPISQVPKKITKSNLEKTIKVYIKSLKLDFGLSDPIVAVSSLNPHNGEEGKIGNEEINIIIRDYGPGLAIKDLDKVFEPFFRAEESRSRSSGGYGLGLYLTKQIADAHGGRISIQNHENGGAEVSLHLPKKQS